MNHRITWLLTLVVLLGIFAHDGRAQIGVYPPPSGGVTSCGTPGVSWLTCTITGPTLNLSPASGQTTFQVLGSGSGGSFAPVILTSSYLPLSSMGTITGGIWNGSAIGSAYGGTGGGSGSSTGIAHVSSGTWSYSAVNLASSDVTGTLPAPNLPAPAGGGPPGGVASITSATSGINTTETTVVSYSVPANTISAGTTYRVVAYGQCTASAANISELRIRFGSSGTASDTALASLAITSATSGTNINFRIEFIITFQSTTVSEVAGLLNNSGTTGIYTSTINALSPTNTTGLTTTSNEILQFAYGTAATTTTSTFYTAIVELVKP